MPFNAGDKITYEFQPGRTGTGSVAYGPFRLAGVGTQMCVVEWLEGDFKGEAQVLPMDRLKPAPRFKVGQVVRTHGVLYKVVAGPFRRSTGSDMYVLEDPNGDHEMEYEAYMVPVVE